MTAQRTQSWRERRRRRPTATQEAARAKKTATAKEPRAESQSEATTSILSVRGNNFHFYRAAYPRERRSSRRRPGGPSLRARRHLEATKGHQAQGSARSCQAQDSARSCRVSKTQTKHHVTKMEEFSPGDPIKPRLSYLLRDFRIKSRLRRYREDPPTM